MVNYHRPLSPKNFGCSVRLMIGERVSERMEARGISQAELARRVGISQQAVHKLVRGTSRSTTHLHRLARELGTSPAYLAGEIDDPDRDAPDMPEMTSDERQVLDCYRQLGAAQRAAWLTIALTMIGEGPAGSVQAPRSSFSEQPL